MMRAVASSKSDAGRDARTVERAGVGRPVALREWIVLPSKDLRMHDDPPGQRTAPSVADEVLNAATDELRRRARLRTGVSRELLGRRMEEVASVSAPERGAGPRVDLGEFDARAYDIPAIHFLAEPRIALAVAGRIASRNRETAIDPTGATYRVEEKSRPGSLLLNGPLHLSPDGSFQMKFGNDACCSFRKLSARSRSRSGSCSRLTERHASPRSA